MFCNSLSYMHPENLSLTSIIEKLTGTLGRRPSLKLFIVPKWPLCLKQNVQFLLLPVHYTAPHATSYVFWGRIFCPMNYCLAIPWVQGFFAGSNHTNDLVNSYSKPLDIKQLLNNLTAVYPSLVHCFQFSKVYYSPNVKSAVEHICLFEFVQLGLSISHLIVNTKQKSTYNTFTY